MLPERRLATHSASLGSGMGNHLRLPVALLLLAVGCRSEEATRRCTEDRAAIENLLQPDQNASELLRQADALAVQRRAEDAARLVDTQVIPACDRALTQADELHPQSHWGRTRLLETVALLAERKRSARAYADALRSGDAEKVLDQMQAQKLVEQKAMSVRSSLATACEQ